MRPCVAFAVVDQYRARRVLGDCIAGALVGQRADIAGRLVKLGAQGGVFDYYCVLGLDRAYRVGGLCVRRRIGIYVVGRPAQRGYVHAHQRNVLVIAVGLLTAHALAGHRMAVRVHYAAHLSRELNAHVYREGVRVKHDNRRAHARGQIGQHGRARRVGLP